MRLLIDWIKGFFRDPLAEFLEFHHSFSCCTIGIRNAAKSQEEIARIQMFLTESNDMERELKTMAALPYAPELEAAFVFAATKRKKAQEFLDAQKLLHGLQKFPHEVLRALYYSG